MNLLKKFSGDLMWEKKRWQERLRWSSPPPWQSAPGNKE